MFTHRSSWHTCSMNCTLCIDKYTSRECSITFLEPERSKHSTLYHAEPCTPTKLQAISHIISMQWHYIPIVTCMESALINYLSIEAFRELNSQFWFSGTCCTKPKHYAVRNHFTSMDFSHKQIHWNGNRHSNYEHIIEYKQAPFFSPPF